MFLSKENSLSFQRKTLSQSLSLLADAGPASSNPRGRKNDEHFIPGARQQAQSEPHSHTSVNNLNDKTVTNDKNAPFD